MGLKENTVHIAASGNHLRTTIRIAQKVLHKDSGIVAVNHVIKREGTVSDINVIEGAELIMPRIQLRCNHKYQTRDQKHPPNPVNQECQDR